MQESKTPTLYERIGGKDAVSAAVDIFYVKVLADDLLRPFFDDIDMQRQKGKQRVFLTYAFGGPVKYDGKDMRAAHAELVRNGLGEEHFTAVATHLSDSLSDLKVDPDLISEVMVIAASTHDDVLGL